jgi:hypothetical protein
VADELVELLEGEVRLAPDVAELEAGVVVAGVLVVDQAEPVADVDEVLGQEIVVAGHRALVSHGHGLLDPAHLGLIVEVAVREPETASWTRPR